MMLVAVTVAALATGTAGSGPCSAPLGRGPHVPAPLVFKTGCGGFMLGTDGRARRLPRRWFAAHGETTGRRFGADLHLRRNRAGRIFVLRRGRLVWRSSSLYPNDVSDVAFGPQAFAFSAWRRGVFRTDLRSPERLVLPGKGWFTRDFFRSGRLIAANGRTIAVHSSDGRVRRYAYRGRGGFVFDEDRNTLFFATAKWRLAALSETRLRVGRRLPLDGFISVPAPGVLLVQAERSFALTTREGRVLARTRWRRSDGWVSGLSVAPGSRNVAFSLADARPGAKRGSAGLFLLAAGETRARRVFRHGLGPVGCGNGALLAWNGRHLLYSSDGRMVIVAAATGRLHHIGQFARSLPRSHRFDRPVAAWAADYR